MAGSKLMLDYVLDHEEKLRDRVYMTQPVGNNQVVDYTWGQVADESRRVMKYVRGQLEQDTTTPHHEAREWNLLAMVEAAQQYDETRQRPDGSQLQATLSTISNLVLLQSRPSALLGKPSGGPAASE